MKPDELRLLRAIQSTGDRPRYAGVGLGIHPKRVNYICEKWARQGLYDCGVSTDMGWLTEKGKRS